MCSLLFPTIARMMVIFENIIATLMKQQAAMYTL
uniref:Uncharacterized protein n=1 Tax=Arundo donax TaxID=35708 RepID=A0A0A8ZPK9_ARUDO